MRDRPLFGPEERPTYWQAIIQLIGHAAGAAFLFISLATLSWLLGWGVEKMNATHAYSPAVLSLLHGVELALLYLDILLSGIVITVSAFRFVREITGPAS